MSKWRKFFVIPVICCIAGVIACTTLTSRESATIQEEESEMIVSEAKSIDAGAEVDNNHPPIEPVIIIRVSLKLKSSHSSFPA